MTTPAHVLVGAVAAKIAINSHLLTGNPMTMYATSILFSNLPDFDVILMRSDNRFHHRSKSILHYPIVWAILFTLSSIFLKPIYGRVFSGYLTFAMIMVGLHFFLDTMTANAGVCWLAPVYRREFSLFPPIKEKQGAFGSYVREHVRKKAFKFEVFLWIICSLYLILPRN